MHFACLFFFMVSSLRAQRSNLILDFLKKFVSNPSVSPVLLFVTIFFVNVMLSLSKHLSKKVFPLQSGLQYKGSGFWQIVFLQYHLMQLNLTQLICYPSAKADRNHLVREFSSLRSRFFYREWQSPFYISSLQGDCFAKLAMTNYAKRIHFTNRRWLQPTD